MKNEFKSPSSLGPEPDASGVEAAASESDALLKDLAEQKDLHLRLTADFENFKRRSRQESEARAAAQKESFIVELLPVMDNLERALASGASRDSTPVSSRGGDDLETIATIAPPAWRRERGNRRANRSTRTGMRRFHKAMTRPSLTTPFSRFFSAATSRGEQVVRPAKVVVNDLTLPSHPAMAVEFKDYYRMLGVTPKATDEEIKKAFRTLARKYHPDVAKDKKTAEAKFKEINEANEVLSNPESRRKFDQLGADWKTGGAVTSTAGSRLEAGPRAGTITARKMSFDSRARDSVIFLNSSLADAPAGRGVARLSTLQRFDNGHEETEPALRGQDIQGDILITLDEVLKGAMRAISVRRTNARTGQEETETYQVRIPKGVRAGQSIRVPGKGGRAWAEARPGTFICACGMPSIPTGRCAAPIWWAIWSWLRGRRFWERRFP